VPEPEEGSNFQHAPPGLRRSASGPSAILPDSVVPPGRRKGKPGGPEAEVPPQYLGSHGPPGGLGMVAVFVLGVGVVELKRLPASGGELVLAVVFCLAGAVGCYAWMQAWLTWRRAIRFEWRWWSRPAGRPFPKGWWRGDRQPRSAGGKADARRGRRARPQ
jgi:hypothetical protein